MRYVDIRSLKVKARKYEPSVNPAILFKHGRNFFQIQKIMICKSFHANQQVSNSENADKQNIEDWLLWRTWSEFPLHNTHTYTHMHSQSCHERKGRGRGLVGWKRTRRGDENEDETVVSAWVMTWYQCADTVFNRIGHKVSNNRHYSFQENSYHHDMFQQFTKTMNYYEMFLTINDNCITKDKFLHAPNKICWVINVPLY